MQNIPLIQWATRHPRLAAWIVLSAGMVIMLVIEAQDVGLQPSQWLALVVATVLVAGLCIWIISWEDEAENAADGSTSTSEPTNSPPAMVAAVPSPEEKS